MSCPHPPPSPPPRRADLYLSLIVKLGTRCMGPWAKTWLFCHTPQSPPPSLSISNCIYFLVASRGTVSMCG